MKNKLLILVFLFFFNFVTSQNKEVKKLIEQTEKLNLDMWELSEFAEKNLSNKKQIAIFFYYWIGKNIAYDYEFLNKMNTQKNIYNEYLKKQDAYRVYEDRKGVCAGYANLYTWFMFEADIEVQKISGHIRDNENHYVELDSDDDFRHAWNAIKINNKWILVDTTWGSSNDPNQSEFYFDIKPEFAINTHYPENNKWQLLETPISLEEFNKSKFINLIWFFSGFSDIPKLKQDKEYYYFIHKTNTKDKNLSVELEISNDNFNYKKITNTLKIDQGNYTYIRFKKDTIPKKAYYKVNFYDYNNDFSGYLNVISFKTE